MDFKFLKEKGGKGEMDYSKQKGITLIALVVTIVVLLILAGVSINAIFNENGLIKKAQEAQGKMNGAVENDQKGLNNLNEWIENVTNESVNTKVEEVSDEDAFVAVESSTSTKYYANLSGISKILEENSTVRLVKNLKENTDIQFNVKNIILTLGEYTLSGTGKLINNGELTIYDGTINVPIENKKTLNIYGGAFNGVVNINGSATVNGGDVNGVVSINGSTTVNGGSFNGNVNINGSATINGGTFNEGINVASGANVTITGGMFKNDVSQYVAAGYGATKDSTSGMYIVAPMQP